MAIVDSRYKIVSLGCLLVKIPFKISFSHIKIPFFFLSFSLFFYQVKKRQQRVLMILDSKNIQYDTVDITEPGKESEKEMMQNKSTSNGGTVSDPEPRHPLPPQIFNDEEYCGDYDAFDMANEIDTLEVFLKLAPADTTAVSTATIELKQENGVAKEEGEKAEESGEGDKAKEDKPAAEEKAEGEAEVKAEV